ncbi:MAG: ATP synthase F1 subunit delta [Candidatus Komeilibacteria bacterium CG10_big_fil_rev_8_21_14_0_10_41_13]|uniref:ATP synthase subunit delta n=1 Tax=Candidatus Komeilibacteria bacterium CG10_big_fil_rev_8_21_14_0_10_41_13 TaxID=1974476 RepID=A0A2M6WC66_9BACT|nr:MAG: ATP synthase F1 subunit delta [Candidatus Komeilibacteria bacterium CG10_big_fil_rev_8_21_14_0_10_41_13]
MRKITPKQYAEGLYQAIKGKTSDELKGIFENFLNLVWQNKDSKKLNKIVDYFDKVFQNEEKLLDAEVISARPLGDNIRRDVINWLESISSRSVNLQATVDQSLISGIKIKYEDLVLDASLKTQLNNLQTQLNK